MTATHWSAIDSTRTVADNLRVRRTEANAYTRLARTYGSKGKIAEPGANLGARPHSRPCTTTDAHGAQTAALSVKADPLDQSGHLVETQRSEGRTATKVACLHAVGSYKRSLCFLS